MLDVKLLQVCHPLGLLVIQILGLLEPCEVEVIGPYFNCMGRSEEGYKFIEG